MKIIPVLDIKDGVVVRGVAGQRDKYQPIASEICFSADPLEVANTFRERFGLRTLYLADLDAIENLQPNYSTYEQLAQSGYRVLIDAGVRQAVDAQGVLAAGAFKVVIALETWPLLSSLELLMSAIGHQQLIFSLDLKSSQPVRCFHDLPADSQAIDIAAAVIASGVRDLIVLDLSSVGMDGGVPTLELCAEIKAFAPKTRLITGGGIRSVSDIDQLAADNIDGVLVASALHDRRLSIDDVKRFA